MYLWATLAARDLGFINNREATKRIDTTLTSVERLERHEPSGQFYNWYDPVTLEKLTVWPESPNNPVYPFLSSVDNGWLASGLLMVANAMPKFRDRAGALAESMNFGCYYDPLAKGADSPGLIRGGFWVADAVPPDSDAFPRDDYCGMGENVVYTGHHYGAFNTEPRIASDIGIALGQIPPEHYFAPWRTFPDTCDWSWTETKPVGDMADLHGRRRVRRGISLRRSARRSDVGRQHVRSPDAGAGRARTGVGTAGVGRSPTRCSSSPRSSSVSRRRATGTGGSLRRAIRPAAIASTASTRSAWSRTGTPPTS